MKIKILQRDGADHTRSRPQEIERVTQNAEPSLHPFERPREYARALNAAKLQRLFAKPFIRAMSGHRDSVYVVARHPNKMALFTSGSADGEVRLWDVSSGCVLGILSFLLVLPNSVAKSGNGVHRRTKSCLGSKSLVSILE